MSNTAFADSMKVVAGSLLSSFGSKGKIISPDINPDPVTGIGGTETSDEVTYFREYITGRETIGSRIDEKLSDRIENNDATIYVVFYKKIEIDMSFEDDKGVRWNIISAAAIETQGKDVMYDVHIRK